MERQLKCATCRKDIALYGCFQLPGEDLYDGRSGFSYNTALNYCKKCYDEMLGKNQVEMPSSIINSNKEIFKEFLKLRIEYAELNKRKKELSAKIKYLMISNNVPKVSFEGNDLIISRCKSVYYYKNTVEAVVPKDLLEKIRTIKEMIYLRVNKSKT